MGKERTRIESVQVIRAIAFILIFLSHVELISTGPIGVSVFLVISGFCMTYAYLDRPEKTPRPSLVNNFKFAWEKAKKLYPLHLVTLLFVSFVIFGGLFLHKASVREIVEQGAYFVANSLLLQSWIPWRDGYFSFNAVSWYLSTTVFSYFLFPWVFQEIQSKDKKRIARLAGFTLGLMVAVAIILGMGGWTKEIIKWVVYICPLYRAGDFILGLIAGYVFLTWERDWSNGIYSVLEIIVIILMAIKVTIYCSGAVNAANWTLTLFWLPTSIICVFLFALKMGAVSKVLSRSKVLIWIGNISGEAFLIHQICIKAAEVVTKNKWVVAVISFAATLTATMTWRWFCKTVREKMLRQA